MVEHYICPDYEFEMFHTYILESQKDRSYYIGSCKDLEKRISLHNQGLVKSTKRALPWKLIHSETFETRKDAQCREQEIKRWKKRSAIEKMISNS